MCLHAFFFVVVAAPGVQFPVEFSLPWILTSTAMSEQGLHEHVLIPLELYNHAANHALYKLKSQTLYDEIEAEVNLCFDQLMFTVSEQVFVNFKAKATSTMLAREAKESSVLQSRAASLDVYRITYRGLLDQRHVRLLGRSIDVNRLIAQVQLCVRVCVCVPVSACLCLCVVCCVVFCSQCLHVCVHGCTLNPHQPSSLR